MSESESYYAQLRSPMWQRRRLETMQRDRFTCQLCMGTDITLHVHHKHYVKGRKAWEYGDDELVTVCETCHPLMHDQSDDVKQVMSKLRIDGPCSVPEAIALIAGWSAHGIPRDDMEAFSHHNEYCYNIGKLASSLYQNCIKNSANLQGLVNSIDSNPGRFDSAMQAFIRALKGE